MPAAQTIRRLTQSRTLRHTPPPAAQIILGLRLCVLLYKCGRNPVPELEQKFGSMAAARRFGIVVEAIGQMWPDPFAVSPPCCPMLSFDESLLSDAAEAAAAQDRVSFDRLTAEMLGGDARETLFATLTEFQAVQALAR